ncbi:hypothetical protein M0802_009777 [Mischocyttarus mexicanus]|nr:hypothetical protein M0802_009777 [Mischocyttarus mexicanus]
MTAKRIYPASPEKVKPSLGIGFRCSSTRVWFIYTWVTHIGVDRQARHIGKWAVLHVRPPVSATTTFTDVLLIGLKSQSFGTL